MTDDDRRHASAVDRPTRDRAEVAEGRFTVPVVVAAVASVPATFLTMLDGPAETVGTWVNHVSLAVFVAETVVLFLLAGDRLRWLREHWTVVAITAAGVPAVLFALGPVQVLRLLRVVRVVGALRIVRVRRIWRAGTVLRRRMGLSGWVSRVVLGLVTVLAAAFVALVLADPTSQSRQLLDEHLGGLPPMAAVLAGVILFGATLLVWRGRRDDQR